MTPICPSASLFTAASPLTPAIQNPCVSGKISVLSSSPMSWVSQTLKFLFSFFPLYLSSRLMFILGSLAPSIYYSWLSRHNVRQWSDWSKKMNFYLLKVYFMEHPAGNFAYIISSDPQNWRYSLNLFYLLLPLNVQMRAHILRNFGALLS